MDPYLGEIRVFGGTFAPRGWALCNGQLLSIAQNTALFSLLGVQFGGDGRTNFALPNMQGNTPVGPGTGPGLSSYSVGQTGGETNHTLLTSEMATHNHTLNGDTLPATDSQPSGNFFGSGATRQGHAYATGGTSAAMGVNIAGIGGGNQPHANQQAYLVMNFIIALQGVFPQRP